jgi:hypothetical protein
MGDTAQRHICVHAVPHGLKSVPDLGHDTVAQQRCWQHAFWAVCCLSHSIFPHPRRIVGRVLLGIQPRPGAVPAAHRQCAAQPSSQLGSGRGGRRFGKLAVSHSCRAVLCSVVPSLAHLQLLPKLGAAAHWAAAHLQLPPSVQQFVLAAADRRSQQLERPCTVRRDDIFASRGH